MSRELYNRKLDSARAVVGAGNKLVIERLEVERGGHRRFVEPSDHGAHGFEGSFAEAIPPERVVQTFEWDGMPGQDSNRGFACEPPRLTSRKNALSLRIASRSSRRGCEGEPQKSRKSTKFAEWFAVPLGRLNDTDKGQSDKRLRVR